MRPTRAHTPSQHYPSPQQSSSQKKYYSREEVSQILRCTVEAKLSKIYQQLDDKQKLIKKLNEQLSHNDKVLQKMTLAINHNMESLNQGKYEMVIETVNKLLNDKLHGYWLSAKNQLEMIRSQNDKKVKILSERFEMLINGQLMEIKAKCQAHIDNYKKKNNAYWLKIKETLGKLNSRIVTSQDSVLNIGRQISKFEQEMKRDSATRKEIEKGRHTAEMLLNLKKSVNNVYNNFEQVLQLQQGIKDRCLENGLFETGVTDGYCHKCGNNLQAKSGYPENTFSLTKNANAYPLARSRNKKLRDDIVILEYSVDDETVELDKFNEPLPTAKVISKNMPSRSHHADRQSPEHPYYAYRDVSDLHSPLSPITSKTEATNHYNEEYNLSHYPGAKYPENSRMLDQISHSFNLTLQQSNRGHLQNGESRTSLGGRSNTISNFQTRNLHNSSNQCSSFLNFSLQARKEMLQSVKPRLIETMEAKNLERPLAVFLDNINYLKNEQGNYIFDLKGNMFKCSHQDFAEMEAQGIIVRAVTKKSLI